MYYLQSRYYDPVVKRFINSDSLGYTGTGFLGYNMFLYCNNSPVNASDTGGGRPYNVGMTDGPGHTPLSPLRSSRSGVTDKNDERIVIDLSGAIGIGLYAKVGVSVVLDLTGRNKDELYVHAGGGLGVNNGLTGSVGHVDNYYGEGAYSGDFYDNNVGYYGGIDHCYSPDKEYSDTVKATSITGTKGFNLGIGYDKYISFDSLIEYILDLFKDSDEEEDGEEK